MFFQYLASHKFYHFTRFLNYSPYLQLVLSDCYLVSTYRLTCVSSPKTITILHTNDMHASFLPTKLFGLKGFRNHLSVVLMSFRLPSIVYDALNCDSLLDDATSWPADPITEYAYQGAEGGACLKWWIAWDMKHGHRATWLWCLCSEPPSVSDIAKFLLFQANILDTLNNFQYIIRSMYCWRRMVWRSYHWSDVKRFLWPCKSEQWTAGIKLFTLSKRQALVEQLHPETDSLLITHQRVDDDSILAWKYRDLIDCWGHSHTRLKHPERLITYSLCRQVWIAKILVFLDWLVEKTSLAFMMEPYFSFGTMPHRPKTELSCS